MTSTPKIDVSKKLELNGFEFSFAIWTPEIFLDWFSNADMARKIGHLHMSSMSHARYFDLTVDVKEISRYSKIQIIFEHSFLILEESSIANHQQNIRSIIQKAAR